MRLFAEGDMLAMHRLDHAASRLIAIDAHVAVDYLWPGVPSQYRIVMYGNASGFVPPSGRVWPPMASNRVH